MIVVLLSGISVLIVSVLAIAFEFTYKQISVGNTLLLAGIIGLNTGLVLVGLYMASRELRTLVRLVVVPEPSGMGEPDLPELDAAPPIETSGRSDSGYPLPPRRDDRSEQMQRSARPPSTYPSPKAATEVTELESGVIEGMAYSLYSDGSIATRTPEGVIRFASIDDLRAQLWP